MLKAVIFDMDDTLIDWRKRTQDWMEYDRQHLSFVYDYIKSIYSDSVRGLEKLVDVMALLSRHAWLEAQNGLNAPSFGAVLTKALQMIGVPANMIDVEACLQAYDWQPVAGVEAFPDVLEIVPLLVSHGVRIGIVTNAFQPMWMRDRELAAYGLLEHFADCRLSAADVGYLKPHPAIFEVALQCLDATTDEAVFVGDNPEADIAGAQSVGMRAVLRINEKTPPLISGLIVPDGAINTLHELLPMLDEWFPQWRNQAGDTNKQAELGQVIEQIEHSLEQTPEHQNPMDVNDPQRPE